MKIYGKLIPEKNAPTAMLSSFYRLFPELRQNLRNGVRIAFLFPLREPLRVSAEQIVLLVAVDLAVSLLANMAYVGASGYMNFYALPGVLFHVLLSFLFALLIARLNHQPSLLLTIPIAFLSAGIVMRLFYACVWLAAEFLKDSFDRLQFQWTLYYFAFAWWVLIALFFLRRYAASGLPKQVSRTSAILRRASYMPLFLLINMLPPIFLPHADLWQRNDDISESKRYARSINNEQVFHSQPGLFKAALDALQPERPGVSDLYFVGFAAYANEDVFMKELRVIEQLLRERFDTQGRSVMLINNPQSAADTPIATSTNLNWALTKIGSLMNRDEDVAFVYLTSHGSRQHELSVDFWPLRLNQITPITLKKMLDDAGIKWRMVVVSACFSGGYIEPLKDDYTLIMTASDPKQTSFGCGSESDFTYFAKALFDQELRQSHSFTLAFDKAKASILKREKTENFEPSNPQIFAGEKMLVKLQEMETRWSHMSTPQTAGVPLHEK
ncbi:MAG: C13 family peptidase [Burkholderiales bacterium]